MPLSCMTILDKKLETAFKEDHTVFAGSDFFDRINGVSLPRVLAKCVVKLYNNKISRFPNTERQPVLGISKGCAPDF